MPSASASAGPVGGGLVEAAGDAGVEPVDRLVPARPPRPRRRPSRWRPGRRACAACSRPSGRGPGEQRVVGRQPGRCRAGGRRRSGRCRGPPSPRGAGRRRSRAGAGRHARPARRRPAPRARGPTTPRLPPAYDLTTTVPSPSAARWTPERSLPPSPPRSPQLAPECGRRGRDDVLAHRAAARTTITSGRSATICRQVSPESARGPHRAVARADVDAGARVVVGAHRVAHHADVEGVGQAPSPSSSQVSPASRERQTRALPSGG